MKVALQMYSVRDAISDEASLFAALEKVREMGYEGVEFAGCFGADAAALKGKLAELGLTAVGCHEGLGSIDKSDMDEMLAFYHAVGVENFVCAGGATGTPEEIGHLCSQMEKLAEKAGKLGMKVGYHNHSHEFKPVNGEKPIEKIAACCPLELDTYWSFVAGEDNRSYMRGKKGKIGLVHLKDGSADGRVPAAVGDGEADIQAVLDVSKELGLEWVIVEVETRPPESDRFADVRRSIENLRSKYVL